MDYRKKVTEMVVSGMKLNEGITEINDDADLIYDLGYDSLSLVSLIVDIETEFDIEIDEDEIENIYKFGNLVDYVNKYAE